jgi:A/G-specific adenine glycosylase
MLQQTGVERVVPKFLAFCEDFPTIHALAAAPQSAVFSHWIGLGYNRRVLYLHRAAQTIVTEYEGVVPDTPDNLRKLPGIGPYAAASIAAFAYNQPTIVIDTNMRTIYIHHFFADEENVADADLISLIEQTLDYDNPREWYSALMDYGTYLKKTVGNVTKKSKHYTVQSPLSGSRREIRGALLKLLQQGPLSLTEVKTIIKENYPRNKYDTEEVVQDLVSEKIIQNKDNILML